MYKYAAPCKFTIPSRAPQEEPRARPSAARVTAALVVACGALIATAPVEPIEPTKRGREVTDDRKNYANFW